MVVMNDLLRDRFPQPMGEGDILLCLGVNANEHTAASGSRRRQMNKTDLRSLTQSHLPMFHGECRYGSWRLCQKCGARIGVVTASSCPTGKSHRLATSFACLAVLVDRRGSEKVATTVARQP
eukprot:6211279-Pleurochrysis_carterae.AAC.1